MTLKLFTFRGRFSGRVHYGTGHTLSQAAKEVGIKPSHLILERSEIIPPVEQKDASHVGANQPSPN